MKDLEIVICLKGINKYQAQMKKLSEVGLAGKLPCFRGGELPCFRGGENLRMATRETNRQSENVSAFSMTLFSRCLMTGGNCVSHI